MRLTLFVLLMLMSVSAVNAQNDPFLESIARFDNSKWNFVFESDNNTRYYVRQIKRKNPDVVRAWIEIRIPYRSDSLDTKEGRYNWLEEFVFEDRKCRTIQEDVFSFTDHSIRSEVNEKAKWRYAIPETAMDSIITYVQRHAKSK
jgi:hypothetical protein